MLMNYYKFAWKCDYKWIIPCNDNLDFLGGRCIIRIEDIMVFIFHIIACELAKPSANHESVEGDGKLAGWWRLRVPLGAGALHNVDNNHLSIYPTLNHFHGTLKYNILIVQYYCILNKGKKKKNIYNVSSINIILYIALNIFIYLNNMTKFEPYKKCMQIFFKVQGNES